MTVLLSLPQSAAVTAIARWFRDPRAGQVMTIGGYGGTGKSTVVKYALQALGLHTNSVASVAFTGKAALVLTRKGTPSETIHRFCYEPKLSSYRDPVTKQLKTKIIGFKHKETTPEGILLIVVDEVSMVSDILMHDLRKFGIKILALGDPGQLAPIMGRSNGLLAHPDVFLDQIHRQAANSPIIWAADLARQGRQIPYGTHGGLLHVIERSKVDVGHVLSADQVIACTHVNRRHYNALVREHLGYDTKLPFVGEKLICKSNRWDDLSSATMTPLVNGMQVRLTEAPARVSRNKRSFWASAEADGVAGDFYYEQEVNLDFFEPLLGQTPDTDADMVHYDFGYAITTHSSQGSEWRSGLLIADTFGGEQERRQLLYTGLSRFAEECTLAR